MRKIVKRPLARADLKQIWRYSFKEWGEAQADTLFADIEAGIPGSRSTRTLASRGRTCGPVTTPSG